MSNFQPNRRPRSAARRNQMDAEAPAPRPNPPPPAEIDLHVFDSPPAWEDTSTVLDIPEQRTFFNRQPAIFWLVTALLMISLFTVVFVIGLNAWREAEANRAEERRIAELAAEKEKYKLPYRDLIEACAVEQGIPPALIASVIYHESRFDPMAVSSVGARGLMQIMPDTGQWIAERLQETEGYTQDSLFDVETSIRFGTWYLGFLARMFEGDIVKIAAGYNAGQGQVGEWLKNPAYSSDGHTLTVIPFAETAQYVSRVVNAYEIYIKHYYTPEEPSL